MATKLVILKLTRAEAETLEVMADDDAGLLRKIVAEQLDKTEGGVTIKVPEHMVDGINSIIHPHVNPVW